MARKYRTNVSGTICARWGSRGCQLVPLGDGSKQGCACGRIVKVPSRNTLHSMSQPVSGAVRAETMSTPSHKRKEQNGPSGSDGGPVEPKPGTQAARVLAMLRDQGTICLWDLLNMRPRVAQYNAVLHHLRHTLGWPIESADCTLHDHEKGAAMHWLAGKETE